MEFDNRWDRYYLSKPIKVEEFGDIEFISKSLLRIKTEKKTNLIQEGLIVPIKINNKSYRCYVLEITDRKIDLVFKEEFEDIGFIKDNTKYIKNMKPSKKITISDRDFDNVKFPIDFINLINLLSEVDDPNADAESLSLIVDKIKPLKSKIIEEANKASENVVEEIKDLTTAISHLGMDKIKNFTYQYFDLYITNYKNPIETFENHNQFSLTKIQTYKKFAPFIPFQPKRKAGILLLLLETVASIVNIFIEKDTNYKNLLKNSVKFYSYPLRIYEKSTFGDDFISLNEIYISKKLKVLSDVYDSYKIAFQTLNPMLKLKAGSLNLSNRNLKRAYLYYLVFLAVNFLVYNDKKSSYILYNRLSRFGIDINEISEFLNEIVFYINKVLTALKIKPYLRTPSPVNYSINCRKTFPDNKDFVDLSEEFKKLGKGKTNRLAVRTQDSEFFGLLLEYLLNDSEIGLHNKSYILIPAEDIQNPDSLLVENLAGFDIIIFKNLENLSPILYREFYKLWKNFEGIIISEYSYYSFIDYDKQKVQLFHIIKENKIDAPLITVNNNAYKFMLDQAKDMYISLFENTNFKNLEKLENDIYDLESVMLMII